MKLLVASVLSGYQYVFIDKRNFSLIDIYQISDQSSDDSRCLDDNPTKKGVIETRTLDKPGRLYDADEQCQLSYGQTSKFCGGGKFLDVSFAIYRFQHNRQISYWYQPGHHYQIMVRG